MGETNRKLGSETFDVIANDDSIRSMLVHWFTEALTLIHGDRIADGWAGVVMHKRLASLEIFWTN